MTKKAKPVNIEMEDPEHMHWFGFKKPQDEGTYTHKVFHNKCLTEGGKQLIEWGYSAQRNEMLLEPRTMCQHCKKELDSVAADKIRKQHEQNRVTRKVEYERRAAIQLEIDKKKVLLGLL